MSVFDEDNALIRRDRSRPPTPISDEPDVRFDVSEITDFSDFRSLSTSAVLSRCKRKILRPYHGFLAVVGFRSVLLGGANPSRIVRTFSHLHLVSVLSLSIFGHVLQYLGCFRRDRGFACETGEDANLKNATFGLLLPSAAHFLGYLYVLYVLRFKEPEELENLLERTFLLSAHGGNGTTHLVKSLWIFISITFSWVVTSICSLVTLLMRDDDRVFQWLHSDTWSTLLKILLVVGIAWQDLVQATVIASYCLQLQFLTSSLHFLRQKLIQHTIQPLSWIREINECQNVLNYLNGEFAPGVCIFLFLNISWTATCSIELFRGTYEDGRAPMIAALVLWSTAALLPFLLAAQLTSACIRLRNLGHEVRIRPFVYQDTPGEDLDTILLYTSTLEMRSKLFSIPIFGPYLYVCFTLTAISVLVAGQTGFL